MTFLYLLVWLLAFAVMYLSRAVVNLSARLDKLERGSK